MSTTQTVTHQATVPTTDKKGAFVRPPSKFRNTIEKGGEYEPEKGRYHLYVNYGCRECCAFRP